MLLRKMQSGCTVCIEPNLQPLLGGLCQVANRASPSNPVSKAVRQERLPVLVPMGIRTALRISEGPVVVDVRMLKVGLRLSSKKGKCTYKERKWQIKPSDEGMDVLDGT